MAVKIKAGAAFSGGLNYDTYIADYLADAGAASNKFYGGTPDTFGGREYFMNGTQIAYEYANSAASRVIMQGENLAYDFIHYGPTNPHAISGDLDALMFGDWVDGQTTGEQGTGPDGAITGLADFLSITGLDYSVPAGHGAADNPVMDLYTLLSNSDVEGIYDFLAQQAQIFVGTAEADTYTGTAFDDKIVGTAGADVLDGGEGVDVITFSNFEAGVSVNLGAGTGPDGSTLANIENVVGTGFEDILLGSAVDNMIKGGHGIDRVYGLDGNDSIIGGSGGDIIHAGAGADTVVGGGDSDDITGRAGADELTGGKGENIFRYLNPVEGVFDSGIAKEDRDLITDFKVGKDLLDFSAMDATPAEGDGVFVFIGTEAFTGEAGELRYSTSKSMTTVAGDIDGDGKADFKIDLTGKLVLTDLDFVL